MKKIKPAAAVGDKPRQKSHASQPQKKKKNNFNEFFKKAIDKLKV